MALLKKTNWYNWTSDRWDIKSTRPDSSSHGSQQRLRDNSVRSQTTYNKLLSAYIRGLFSCWLVGCEVTERLGLQSASLANPYFVILPRQTLNKPRCSPTSTCSWLYQRSPALAVARHRAHEFNGSPLQRVANYLARLVDALPQDITERHVEQNVTSMCVKSSKMEDRNVQWDGDSDLRIFLLLYPRFIRLNKSSLKIGGWEVSLFKWTLKSTTTCVRLEH